MAWSNKVAVSPVSLSVDSIKIISFFFASFSTREAMIRFLSRFTAVHVYSLYDLCNGVYWHCKHQEHNGVH